MAPKKRAGAADPAEVMKETLRIIQTGSYKAPGGNVVKLDVRRLRSAPSRAVMYKEVASEQMPSGAMRVRLFNGCTIEAAHRLSAEAGGAAPLVLDFASDSNAGGGCRSNQRGTQEESLCRQTSLLPSLERLAYPIPRLGVVYAPDICVIRTEEAGGYALRAEPFWINVIAAALPNCGGELDGKQRGFVAQKIRSVLNVAAKHGHTQLVLGAWGCGAFGNVAGDVANVFRTELRRANGLDIVFAVTGRNFEAFRCVLQADVMSHSMSDAVHTQASISFDQDNQEAFVGASQVPQAELECIVPLAFERDLSDEYAGRGASRHDVPTLEQWKQHRDAAAQAQRARDWPRCIDELRTALMFRPDWAQGHIGLHDIFLRLGDVSEASRALSDGLVCCAASLSSVIASQVSECDVHEAEQDAKKGSSAQDLLDGMSFLAQKISTAPSKSDPCAVLGISTLNDDGSARIFYHKDGPLLDIAPSPLRLLFLDTDGVLNVAQSADGGLLISELVVRVRSVLVETGAIVVLSSSWRHWGNLRTLIIGALPACSVVGQTPAGFRNESRPCEIAHFLESVGEIRAVSSWAVIDNMDLLSISQSSKGDAVLPFLPELERRFVRTDKSVGITDMNAAHLIRILSSK